VTDETRTCATCACFARVKQDGTVAAALEEAAPSCRRFAPSMQMARIEVPSMSATGKQLIDGKGKPRTEFVNQLIVIYPPTRAGLVCFDGWRPLGTLPGEKSGPPANS
jgi:hypothetical protein